MDWPVPPPKRGRPRGRQAGHSPDKKKREGNPYNTKTGLDKITSKQIIEGARKRAALSGDLPHEFLLGIMRGNCVWHDGVKIRPSLEMRIDCAKAAAPFYSPKLAQVSVTETMSDADLDFIIKSAAAEAGISLGLGGEIEAGSERTGAGQAHTTH